MKTWTERPREGICPGVLLLNCQKSTLQIQSKSTLQIHSKSSGIVRFYSYYIAVK